MRFQQEVICIFILLLLQGKYFTHARRVNKAKVTVVTAEKDLDNYFSLQKGILPNAARVERAARIVGRKISAKTKKKTNNRKKVSMASSEGAVGKRKGDEEKNWKDNFMAFSADYRSPKPHPPKNN